MAPAVALFGALIWIVPGGLGSDIPGSTLFACGVIAEVVSTALYLLQRSR